MERAAICVWEFDSAASRRTQDDETALIRSITAGDKGRFCDLIQPHLAFLWRTVRARVNYDADAEDIVQEVLLKVFRRLAQFRFASSFRTWLYRIAINEVWQARREAGSWRMADIGEMDFERALVVGCQDAIEARYQQWESEKILGAAIQALPEKYRLVVQLRDLNGLSIAETARSLLLTSGAVKTRHHRARNLLRRQVKESAGAAAARLQAA